jgi:hypothetical protein
MLACLVEAKSQNAGETLSNLNDPKLHVVKMRRGRMVGMRTLSASA